MANFNEGWSVKKYNIISLQIPFLNSLYVPLSVATDNETLVYFLCKNNFKKNFFNKMTFKGP